MKCKCGSQFLPLDEDQKKCVTCEVISACRGYNRKCWNDEPEMCNQNYTYTSNENYLFVRSDVKPTHQYWLTPLQIFEFIKNIENSKRIENLYLSSQIRRNVGMYKHIVKGDLKKRLDKN